MNTFILTIILQTSSGLSVPVLPVSYATMEACQKELKSTYASPMGKYKLVKALCRKGN